jgi:hypothetical protein
MHAATAAVPALQPGEDPAAHLKRIGNGLPASPPAAAPAGRRSRQPRAADRRLTERPAR